MVYREVLLEKDVDIKLATLKGSKGPIYLLFTAERNATGQRWCPDSRSADPILEEVFETLPASAVLLEIAITKESWKINPGKSHPFRSAPFSVRGIPTLALWDAVNGKVAKQFTEGECEQLEVLQEFLSSHY